MGLLGPKTDFKVNEMKTSHPACLRLGMMMMVMAIMCGGVGRCQAENLRSSYHQLDTIVTCGIICHERVLRELKTLQVLVVLTLQTGVLLQNTWLDVAQ